MRLHNEVKKRTEMTKSIKTWCDTHVEEIVKFQHDVTERRIKLQERVDGLRERTNDMRRRFTVDMHAIPLDISSAVRLWRAAAPHDGTIRRRKQVEEGAGSIDVATLACDESRTASSFPIRSTEREMIMRQRRRSMIMRSPKQAGPGPQRQIIPGPGATAESSISRAEDPLARGRGAGGGHERPHREDQRSCRHH